MRIFDLLRTLPLYCIPHHVLSKLTFKLARVESSLKFFLIKTFIRRYGVDMSEALNSDIYSYKHFNDFFTRELKSGARQLATDDQQLISPADGRVSQIGTISNAKLLQAKGHEYSLHQLLGGSEDDAKPFLDGLFTTIYLSPKDYHRLHMPISGQLKKMVYVPGRLFSVAPHTTRTIPGLFARNERLICYFETPIGKFALIMVGAINVAGIETVWHGLVQPKDRNVITHYDYEDLNLKLKQGDEMGRFNIGSTVILVTENRFNWLDTINAGQSIQLGNTLAKLA